MVPRPKGKQVVGSKFIYIVNHVVDESMDKYKARFMTQGFSQKEGEGYEETFSLVAIYTSIRVVISIAAEMG